MDRRADLSRIDMVVAFAALLMTFPFAIRPVVAQSPTSEKGNAIRSTSFDVVSIRPANPNSAEISMGGLNADTFYLKNLPLTGAITTAFYDRGKVPSEFVSSLPQWVREERFDLTAKVSASDYESLKLETGQAVPDIPMEMLHPMLQNMLKERCNLAVHHTKTIKIGFSLEVGKKGINRKRMKESTASESVPSDAHSFGGVWLTKYTESEDRHNSKRYFYKMTMGEFASHISSATRVVDNTGLSARYDFSVGLVDGANDVSERYYVAPLGLQFKKTEFVVDTVVIDHIDRPTQN